MEGHKAYHWGRDPFNKAVVLLKDVVKVFDVNDLNRLALLLPQTFRTSDLACGDS